MAQKAAFSLSGVRFVSPAAVGFAITKLVATGGQYVAPNVVGVHRVSISLAAMRISALPILRCDEEDAILLRENTDKAFVKGLHTPVLATEVLYVGVLRTVTDYSVTTDVTAMRTVRRVPDYAAAADSKAFMLVRKLRETVPVADKKSMLVARTLREAAEVQEYAMLAMARRCSEALVVAEAARISVARTLRETAVATDSHATAITKVIYENISIGETTELVEVPLQAASEYAPATDAKRMAVVRKIADASTVADSATFYLLPASCAAYGDVLFGESTFGD